MSEHRLSSLNADACISSMMQEWANKYPFFDSLPRGVFFESQAAALQDVINDAHDGTARGTVVACSAH